MTGILEFLQRIGAAPLSQQDIQNQMDQWRQQPAQISPQMGQQMAPSSPMQMSQMPQQMQAPQPQANPAYMQDPLRYSDPNNMPDPLIELLKMMLGSPSAQKR